MAPHYGGHSVTHMGKERPSPGDAKAITRLANIQRANPQERNGASVSELTLVQAVLFDELAECAALLAA